MTPVPDSPIAPQRAAFDIPADVAYFNCAYMSPLAHRVVAAGERGVRRKARPWRIVPEDFFTEVERVRARFGELIGADAEGVAVVPSASYAIALAARNLPLARGESILVLDGQFPSNVYAWRERAGEARAQVVTVPRPGDGDWTRVVLERLRPGVAIAALPHCHWTDGARLDLESIARRCRDTGTRLVLDLTQSAGAMPFDCERVRPDFVACAGYKWLLGPYSLGCLYVAPPWREGTPLERGWMARAGAEDFASLVDYRDRYRDGARRFDVGETSNFVLVPMLNEALAMLLEWQVPRIAATLAARNAALAAQGADLGLEVLPEPLRAPHFLGLRLPRGGAPGRPGRIAAVLGGAGVHVSVRGDCVRVTGHLYNTPLDEERLLDALSVALSAS
jgi:selenocysteine lyase/cysteine desulfurase